MKPLKIGIVGCGALAQRGLLPHLTQEDLASRVRVHAVCDPAPGRAEAAARKFNVPAFFETLDDMLARSDVDLVSIASPISLHFEQGLAALRSGRHVHFNKTMSTTSAEATTLIELASAKGLRIVASPGEILRPQLRAARKLLASGAIGVPCWAATGGSSGDYHENEHEFRSGSTPLSNVDPSWFYRRPGGGPLYNIVVYHLHALTSLLGPARRVSAMSGLRMPTRTFNGKTRVCDMDDTTLLTLDFGDNLLAFCHGTPNGWLVDGFYPKVFGSSGVLDGLLLNGKPYDYPGKQVADEAPGWTGEQWVLPHVTGPHRHIDEQHVFEDVMQLVDWILDGKPSPVTAEHARHVIEIFEAGYRAAQTGTTQSLQTTFRLPPLQ